MYTLARGVRPLLNFIHTNFGFEFNLEKRYVAEIAVAFVMYKIRYTLHVQIRMSYQYDILHCGTNPPHLLKIQNEQFRLNIIC